MFIQMSGGFLMTLVHLAAYPLNISAFFFLRTIAYNACLKNTNHSRMTVINIAITFVLNLVTLVLAHTIMLFQVRKQNAEGNAND